MGKQDKHVDAMDGIPRQTQEPALVSFVDNGCTIRLRRTLLGQSMTHWPSHPRPIQPASRHLRRYTWKKTGGLSCPSHSSGMICQVRTGDGGLDLQEPSSLAVSPTSTVRFVLTSQHLLSITKKYMLMLDTCPLRNLPFPCVD